MALGCLAMAGGLLVYWMQRDLRHAALIPAVAPLAGHAAFGALGQWLPSFVHPLAFSLFTAALLPPRAGLAYGICAAWAGVNVAFEIGQHPQISAHLAGALAALPGPSVVTQALANYFVRGTFDAYDLAAAILGALLAAWVLCHVRHEHGPG